MKILLVVASNDRPSDDARIVFEIANQLAAEGDEIHLVHFTPGRKLSRGDVSWFPFKQSIAHHFEFDLSEHGFQADITFGLRTDEWGLPVILWKAVEDMAENEVRYNCPKICLSQFLIAQGQQRGIPQQQLHYLRPGIDHSCFSIVRGLADRPLHVAMRWSDHLGGRPDVGLQVLQEVRRRVPEVAVSVFGAGPAPADLPGWITYLEGPSDLEVSDQVYNVSRVFLNSADAEGVGWSSIEAMASGCALVTTGNGGSADFALPDQTALVTRPGDVGALADGVVDLLLDDGRRIELATDGAEFVQRFRWPLSVQRLRSYLERYLRKPEFFRPEPRHGKRDRSSTGGHDRAIAPSADSTD